MGDADPVIAATLESAIVAGRSTPLPAPSDTDVLPAAVIADDNGALHAKVIGTAPAVADYGMPGSSVLDTIDEADLCGACLHRRSWVEGKPSIGLSAISVGAAVCDCVWISGDGILFSM